MSETRHRMRVLEASILIVIARLLIRFIPFGHWRKWLGNISQDGAAAAVSASGPPPAALPIIQAARRASKRQPAARCLPQAIAVHKMARRRRIQTQLVIGALPGQKRGTLDDLHAWVELEGRVIWGDSAGVHRPLFKLL